MAVRNHLQSTPGATECYWAHAKKEYSNTALLLLLLLWPSGAAGRGCTGFESATKYDTPLTAKPS
jgi:hypothetical protein